jgi:2-polyprenyl-3-methyl-5-hydroxy-6-metoxy-1,4-benzoquinol methylase
MISGGEIPPKYSRLVPYISGSSILDVGFGEDLLPLALAKPAKVVGIDISPKRREIPNNLLEGPYSAKKGFV